VTDREIRTDVEMQCVARDKSVHLLFSERDAHHELVPTHTSNFLMSASDALSFSSLLADLAFEIESGLRLPEAQKAELVQRHRTKLMERITVMLNSQREKKTINNRSLARQLVDVMSNEVFN
jgi:hypothetical protein